MTEKPLHVRVAEALGWIECKFHKPRPGTIYAQGHWRGRAPQVPPYPHTIHEVPRYDTDWSATGPLIEKYRIQLLPQSGGVWVAANAWAFEHIFAEGASPLIATCEYILKMDSLSRLNAPPPNLSLEINL